MKKQFHGALARYINSLNSS